MTPEILLVPSGLALVPGATGRVDDYRGERDAVVATLARTLAAAARRAERAPRGVTVTVVAPAPVAATRTTDLGIPDLGAVGLDVASHDELARYDRGGAGDLRAVPLHVAASVVTVLLRLAGWQGATRTVEIGGEALAGGEDGLSSWLEVQDEDGHRHEAVRVLVFTTLGARVGLAPDGDYASGVPDLLRRADAAVTACHRAAAARAMG